MISEDSLTKAVLRILGQQPPRTINLTRVAETLNRLSEANNIEINAYGYIMYLVQQLGETVLGRNALAHEQNMEDYVRTAVRTRDDMPSLLVNAGKYVDRVFSTVQEPELCMQRLREMTFPYVLYVLFAAAGQEDQVADFRDAFLEQMRRYPATLDLLPESYRKLAEQEEYHADAQ